MSNDIQTLHFNIPFRDDYNGRPKILSFDDMLILVTHPFYCWKQPRYGRVYDYHVIDNVNKQIDDRFKIRLFDTASHRIEHMIDRIINDVKFTQNNEFLYNLGNGLLRIIKSTDYSLERLDNSMGNNACDDILLSLVDSINKNEGIVLPNENFYGYVRFCDKIYLIIMDSINWDFPDEKYSEDVNLSQLIPNANKYSEDSHFNNYVYKYCSDNEIKIIGYVYSNWETCDIDAYYIDNVDKK